MIRIDQLETRIIRNIRLNNRSTGFDVLSKDGPLGSGFIN